MSDIFSLEGKTAVVLGGAGILGAALVQGLARAGASVAIAGRTHSKTLALAERLAASGLIAKGLAVDTTSKEGIESCLQEVLEAFGGVDILVNAVGGNRPEATTNPERSFFDVSAEALKEVVDLNLFGGAVLPCQVFGRVMAESGKPGSIINVSSMSAVRPLTRVLGYGAAKAAVDNFTRWLAVDMAKTGHEHLRVNAIAPGFFLTEQNRFLLTDKDSGNLTARGQSIIDHTPMGRFGDPDDLVGALVWLASDASRFVTGIVVPVDGGFSAFSGV